MNILAIETTGAQCSVAVINEKKEITEESSNQRMNHLQNLMPMTELLLSNCGMQISDITHIAVSEGPGSFTGIRIGMASAKALAQVLSLDMIAVPTLQAFAYNVPEYEGLICPILDARRSQVYGGAYRWEGAKLNEVVPGGAYTIGEFLELVDSAALNTAFSVTFFGDGIVPCREGIEAYDFKNHRLSTKGDGIRFAEEAVRLQRASSVAKLAYDLYEQGSVTSVFEIQPVYMRKAEAERKLEEKQAAERKAALRDESAAAGGAEG